MKSDPHHPSRRHFLKSTALALGALPLTSFTDDLFPPAPDKGKKVRVGGHVWVYSAAQPNYDCTPVMEQVFSDFRYAGIEGVELMERNLRHADAVDRLSSLWEKYGVPVMGASYGANMWNREEHPKIEEDVELVVGRLQRLGGQTLGLSVGQTKAPKTEAELDAQGDLLKKIVALCQRKGIVANLHNHTYEVDNQQHDLKGTLARVPGIRLGPDLNWLIRAGIQPADFISEFGKRIIYVHLRDQLPSGEWSEALGEGSTDFAAIARSLKKINFSGLAAIELAHPAGFQLTRPLKESWKLSRDFVKQKLGY
jgi:sugar phosphate isomerase/epimerase